jgi:hypothetical protein
MIANRRDDAVVLTLETQRAIRPSEGDANE